MKKLIIAALLMGAFAANAQDITGSWAGSINAAGKSIELIFNIGKTGDTTYVATFDSPSQMAFGIPCKKVSVKNDSLFIDAGVSGIKYNGLWKGNDGITGTFIQGVSKLPLDLARLKRPQTPKPPFNYYTEDVEYNNAAKTLHYGATFTRPSAKGKYPAVIIITGSGTQDRDGTLFGHKLYYVLADYLTRNGIAVLRVDDRGAGISTTGGIKNATSLDFSYDVETSLNYLKTRPDVDKKYLGLIGHSEGGIIAPMVAARRKDVSFIVMWGGPEIGGKKTNIEQNIHALKLSGISDSATNAFIQLHSQVLDLVGKIHSQAQLDSVITPVFIKWKQAQSPATLTALNVSNSTVLGTDFYGTYNQLYNAAWLRFFVTYDPETDLAKVICPVLAVNGEKDTQVNAEENLAAIKALPGLNHLLQSAQTGDISEYETSEETMSPAALDIICSWIKIHTK